jgi:hypothetical protein
MSPATLPAAFVTPAIAAEGAVRVRRIAGRRRTPVGAHVAEEHLTVPLERIERRVVGVVAALAVGDGIRRAAPPTSSGERRVESLGRCVTSRQTKRSDRVAQEGARHEPASARTWNPLQMPEHEAAVCGERRDGAA